MLSNNASTSLLLCNIALDDKKYITRELSIDYEGHEYNVGNKFRSLQDRRHQLSEDIRKSLQYIEMRNAKLKPESRVQIRAKAKAKKIVPAKSSRTLIKQRQNKRNNLVEEGRANETTRIGLHTCGAVCYRNGRLQDKYHCANVNLLVDRCQMHAKKRWEGLTLYDPKDTHSTSKQNTYLAPSNLAGAGMGVFSNTTLRKGDYVAMYGIQCIVSRAQYDRDYKGTGRIECDYAIEISTAEVAIGLTKPVAGEGIGSFLNSSYRNKQYPNNCKFVVHDQSIVVVLDIEALSRHHELLVPYNRPL
jgi:hypothetical protein